MHPSPDILALLALGETAGTPAERDHVDSCPQCRNEVAELARAVAAGRGQRRRGQRAADPARSGVAGDPRRAGVRPGRFRGGARGHLGPTGPHPHRAPQPRPGRAGRPNLSPDDGSRPARCRLAAAGSPRSLWPPWWRWLPASAWASVWTGSSVRGRRCSGPPISRPCPRSPGPPAEAVVEQDAEGNKTLVIEVSSPPRVDGSQEVWLIDRDVNQMRSLGYLTPTSNRFGIPADLDPRQFPVVDVSAEPPNDAEPGTRATRSSAAPSTSDAPRLGSEGSSPCRRRASPLPSGRPRTAPTSTPSRRPGCAGWPRPARGRPGSPRWSRSTTTRSCWSGWSPAGPERTAAEDFGRALAVTHAAGAAAYGQPPDGWAGDGYIGNQA